MDDDLEAERIPPDGDQPDRAPLADIAQRSVARIIDSGVVIFFWMLVTAVYYTPERQVSTAMINVALLALYEVVPVVKTGQTFGKRVMSIGIVMAKDGRYPPLINAFLRVAPADSDHVAAQQYFIFALPFLYSTAGFVESRRGAVDLLSGTAVIKRV